MSYQKSFTVLNNLFDRAISGETEPVSYDESLLSVAEGKLLRYIRTNQERLSQTKEERNYIKRLISDISHQTKTPLANILLFSSLLQENTNLNQKDKQHIDDICEQSEKLKFLIDALVKMSRLESGVIAVAPVKQPLKSLIQGVVSEAYPKLSQKHQHLAVACEADITGVFDMRWTKEALFNVLDNAVKYTPEQGHLQIRVIPLDLMVRIDISDDGIGIPESEVQNIFKRFYRLEQSKSSEGIGVGLYLAREIIQLQGGYISVKSGSGRGSTFSVLLPKGQ